MCIDHPRTLHLNGVNTFGAAEQWDLVISKNGAQETFTYVGNRIFTQDGE